VPWLQISTALDRATAIHSGFVVFIVGGIAKAAIGAATLPLPWRLVDGRT
jgi:biotin transport system substrate-specific component